MQAHGYHRRDDASPRSQVVPTASSVFIPSKGVKPKKIPTATPAATARGESLTSRSFVHCKVNRSVVFMRESLVASPQTEMQKV